MHFSWGQGGSGVQDMTPPLLGNLGADKFSETSFPISSPILCKTAVSTFIQQFKTIDYNNFTLSPMFFFQNARPIKRKAVHTLVLLHIFVHFLVACKNRIRSQV